MGVVESFLIAIALAMDCFTVSITCGIIQRRMGTQAWGMALMFGVFQAGMAFIGWSIVGMFTDAIQAYDHWVAFSLLGLLGGKMIWEGMHPKVDHRFNPSRFIVLLMLSIATSIDALAVGCSFVGMGFHSCLTIIFPVIMIGLVSFLLSLLGKYIGVKIGHRLNWPTEQIGGVILILIGLKVLIEHIHLSI